MQLTLVLCRDKALERLRTIDITLSSPFPHRSNSSFEIVNFPAKLYTV
jgi:hypothetical protein